jgi:hypothetical protein
MEDANGQHWLPYAGQDVDYIMKSILREDVLGSKRGLTSVFLQLRGKRY